MAIAIHNHYVETQIAAGETVTDNATLVSWEGLPETLKDANRSQADHLQIKCHVLTGKLNYTTAQIEQQLSDPKTQGTLRVWNCVLDGWRCHNRCKKYCRASVVRVSGI